MDVDVDVLVVGAGPTGLTVALELTRRGVAYRLVDRRLEDHAAAAGSDLQSSRALDMQGRTQEILADLGVLDRLLEEADRVQRGTVHIGQRTLFGIDLRTAHTYPHFLSLPQYRTERAMDERLVELGGKVEHGLELVALAQEPGRVLATLVGNDGGQHEIAARWLVAADGGRSRIRKLLGLDFAGRTHAEHYVHADLEVSWGQDPGALHLWLHPDGVLVAVPHPTKGMWRLVFDVDATTLERQEPPTLALITQLLRERTGDTSVTVANPRWTSFVDVNTRLVQAYRSGRVFLAGDAAHVHSFFGAQGLSLGVQDAYNLAWKLSAVLQHHAPEELLNTYEAERRPIARNLLSGTSALQRLLVSQAPAVRVARDRLAPALFAWGPFQRRLISSAHQLDVTYRRSSLSRRAGGALQRPLSTAAPQPGDRAPDTVLYRPATGEQVALYSLLRGPQWTLLVFIGSQAETGQALEAARATTVRSAAPIDVYVLSDAPVWGSEADPAMLIDPNGLAHRRYATRRGGLVLIRPDGYVGFCGPARSWADLERYLPAVTGRHDAAHAPATTRNG